MRPGPRRQLNRRVAIRAALAILALGVAGASALGLVALGGRLGIVPSAGPAQLVTAELWPTPQDWHGGFSAIEVDATGTRALLLSDSGYAMRARLHRGPGDALQRIEPRRVNTLQNVRGRGLVGIPDAEGLATRPGAVRGPAAVSLEWQHRVILYEYLHRRPMAVPRRIGRAPAWRDLDGNRGPEALAMTEGGALIAIAEGVGPGGHDVSLWQGGTDWQPLAPLPETGWAPVGADIGPDGRLYLLERRFLWSGFGSRIRAFDPGPGGLGPAETILVTPLGRHGNLEGIAVWQAADGLRATLIGDDNYLGFQRGELVEYALAPPAQPR